MKTSKDPAWPSKWLLSLLAGMVVGGGVTYSYLTKKSEPISGPGALAYFDKDVMTAMMTDAATDLRFYNAQQLGGGITAMGVPVDVDGVHIPDASGALVFKLYKGLRDHVTEMSDLNEDEALAQVIAIRSAGGTNCSAFVSKADVERMLGLSGCNGLALYERRLSGGELTFEFAPVKLGGGVAVSVGSAADILVCAAPCPRICGPVPTVHLHMR